MSNDQHSVDQHSLLAPYALDALDADERSTFEAHLEQCATCRDELNGFVGTAARLGEIDVVEPPASLRADVLVAARRSVQDRPLVSLSQQRRLRRRVPQLVAAAGVVIALAGGAMAWTEHDRASEVQTVHDEMTSVLMAPDAASASRASKNGGALRVIASASRDAAVVVGSSLPRLDGDRVYQVWTMHDGRPRSAGIIGSEAGMLYVPTMGDADAFAVTIEPAGGSRQPTTDPLAVTPMTA